MSKLHKTLLSAIAVVLALTLVQTGLAHAATFNQNEIIDDGVFDNTSSMTAAQIDSWLNANFGSASCISTDHGFSAPDPIGYNQTQGFLYGGNVSAGQVIYDAAQAYSINPQVLLTTIQKEQGLVDGSGPQGAGCITLGYAAAAGYGCLDGGTAYNYSGVDLYSINGVAVTSVSGTCVNTSLKVGFSQQVIRAAWLLKFGEQRSEGNVSWAVIKGNWNNSDDPQSCYAGPMTQGTFARCPSGGSAYYDGYTTIDGTSVHMDNGATASLYWYTPHFVGNQSFYSIFTGWFGSTLFLQPTGGLLYYQTSTGKIYLVTDSTRYYVATWSMMVNYGLDTYPLLNASDATINSYTDGGTLTNLIWNSGGVYLVNNRTKYHVPSSECTTWGLACSDSSVTHELGQMFDAGFLRLSSTDLPPLLNYNGTYYKMDNGNRDPFANTQSVTASGFTTSQALVANVVNASQPLGPLILKTTPSVIKLGSAGTMYYFDGSSYHAVPSTTVLDGWKLDKLAPIVPPASTFNTAGQPSPLGAALTSWYESSGGQKYLLNLDAKYPLSTQQQLLWPSPSYTSGSFADTLATTLPQATLQTNIWSSPGVYVLGDDGEKHHVPTYNDYLALGINSSNTTTLSPDLGNLIATGADAFGNGKVIGIQNGLYVVNNGSLIHIPTANVFDAFGFNWSGIPSYPTTITTSYPISTDNLQKVQTSDGSYNFTATGQRLSLSPTLAVSYGLRTSLFSPVAKEVSQTMTKSITMSKFLYDTENGRIYYASGGAIHYVASYAAFVAYGGLHIPATNVTNDIVNSFTEAQDVY